MVNVVLGWRRGAEDEEKRQLPPPPLLALKIIDWRRLLNVSDIMFLSSWLIFYTEMTCKTLKKINNINIVHDPKPNPNPNT